MKDKAKSSNMRRRSSSEWLKPFLFHTGALDRSVVSHLSHLKRWVARHLGQSSMEIQQGQTYLSGFDTKSARSLRFLPTSSLVLCFCGLSTLASAQSAQPSQSQPQAAPPSTSTSSPVSPAQTSQAVEVAKEQQQDPFATPRLPKPGIGVPRPTRPQVYLPPRSEEDRDIESGVTFRPGHGFTVKAGNEFAMNMKAYFQARSTTAYQNREWSQAVTIPTMRLIITGYAFSPKLTYWIQYSFGPGDYTGYSPSPILDTLMNYEFHRDFNVQVGQMPPTFARHAAIAEPAYSFVGFPQSSGLLTLGRDIGVAIQSSDFLGMNKFRYAVGVYGGEGRNRVSPFTPGFLYTADFGYHPFGPLSDYENDLEYNTTPKLAFSLSGAFNHQAGRTGGNTGADYVASRFNYLHGAANARLKYSGLDLNFEGLVRGATENYNDPVDPATGARLVDSKGAPLREWSVSGIGYFIQAGQMITKQAALGARWGQTFALGNTDPSFKSSSKSLGNEIALGFTYYIHGRVMKFNADYVARFGDGSGPSSHTINLQIDTRL